MPKAAKPAKAKRFARDMWCVVATLGGKEHPRVVLNRSDARSLVGIYSDARVIRVRVAELRGRA